MSAKDASDIVYATNRLQSIGNALNLSQSVDSLGNIAVKLPEQKRPINIAMDSYGRIKHLGFNMFTPDQRTPLTEPALNFIERYTLEASLPLPRMNTLSKQLLEDDVNMTNCTLQSLPALAADSTLTVTVENQNGRRYRIAWTRGATVRHAVEFPLSYDLLSGCDIDENENRLSAEIKRFTPALDTMAVNIAALVPAEIPEVYAMPGDSYFLDNLSSTRYFEDDDDEITPLYDLDYPAHTVANMFTGTDLANDFDIDVKLRKYDYKVENFSVPLAQLVGYFISEGCRPYFGTIKLDDGEIVGLSLFVNPPMGYCHAMKITMRERDLMDRSGHIKARLVSYIPVSRISNIFDEFKQ